MDERTTDVPSYNIYVNMWTVSLDINIQWHHWQPLSVHLWAYCTHPTHDENDVMCEGWPHQRGLCPLVFSNSGVGSFTSHKNQISISAVRQDLQFFVSLTQNSLSLTLTKFLDSEKCCQSVSLFNFKEKKNSQQHEQDLIPGRRVCSPLPKPLGHGGFTLTWN